jgi:hypothetical protein
MGWTFNTVERSPSSPRTVAEQTASHIKHLEHREAEHVRRLVALKERHAFFPTDVTGRHIEELAAELEELRTELDSLRVHLPPDPHAA